MTSVCVYLLPIGEYHAPRATADEFTKGVLTVTFLDSGRVARIFRPHSWARCDVLEENGYPSFSFIKEPLYVAPQASGY